MPINSEHPVYADWRDIWILCRDCVAGERAIKLADNKYLPRLSGMEAEDYLNYKYRAMFYAATDRTVKGCTGSIMRKPAKFDCSDDVRQLLPEMGASDESSDMVIKAILDEVLTSGRCGILVDSASDDEDTVKPGVDPYDPYVVTYAAENITNWRSANIGGEDKLILVVLKEQYEELDEEDSYIAKQKVQYRELTLTGWNGENDPVYVVNVWREVERSEEEKKAGKEIEWEIFTTTTPTNRGGKTFDFIPFVFATPTVTGSEIQKPPVYDLATVNVSHYRNSADLEWGRHFTALPTPWAAGFEADGNKLKIGSAAAWVSANPQAHCGFLEFSGEGLGHLQTGLTEKESLMAVLGARLLEERNDAVAETATTVKLRHQGDHSILANVAIAVSEALMEVLEWMGIWIGIPPETAKKVDVELNKDYEFAEMNPEMLTSLVTGWQSGALSWAVVFYNLQKGGLYPENTTKEDELAAILAGMPGLTPGKLAGSGGLDPNNGQGGNQGAGNAPGSDGKNKGGNKGNTSANVGSGKPGKSQNVLPPARPIPALSSEFQQ